MATINPPKTYAEWVAVLDALKNKKADDETILAAMQRGSLQWQSGVAERFSKKLVEAINTRMNTATDRFQKEMGRAGGQERVLVQSLMALRKEFSFLTKAINVPVIPEKDRAQYVRLVLEQADSVQNSLEDSAKRDRTGKLASIIRSNKVNSF
ncbi:MAG: hypothetical protein IJ744_03615 [Lachnospiraceae bacterium]|nr:hypothetical protein [Lachnospiraceae bacterium]